MAGAKSNKSKAGSKSDVKPREWIAAARAFGVAVGPGSETKGQFELLAQDDGSEPGGERQRKFKGQVYSGGKFGQWWGTAIIDLDGLKLPKSKKPALTAHGWSPGGKNTRVGFSTSVTKDARGVSIEGVLLSNEGAQEIIRDADEGFPFELSIHATVEKEEFVGPGQVVKVNGREFIGPVIVARESIYREATICEIGADPNTQFQMAASAGLLQGVGAMAGINAGTIKAATDGGDEDMVKKSDIDAEYIRANLPDVAKALAEDGAGGEDETTEDTTPGEGETPVTETQASATIVQLEAMASGLTTGKADWVLKAAKSGWNQMQASVDLNQVLALELKATGEKLAEATTKLEAALKGGGANPLTQPSAEQLRSGSAGAVGADGFAGAAGKDPNEDWNASEQLREHWKGRGGKRAFDVFARLQMGNGESYLLRKTA